MFGHYQNIQTYKIYVYTHSAHTHIFGVHTHYIQRVAKMFNIRATYISSEPQDMNKMYTYVFIACTFCQKCLYKY